MAIASNLGFPRIGARRELKRAVEGYWDGSIDPEELQATAATPPPALAAAARRRHRAHPLERFLALRPRARHGRDGRRRAEAVRLARRDGRPGHLLRHGPRHRSDVAAAGDDQVVRHELPLPRPRVRAGHDVPARLDQAGRRVPRGRWRWASTPGRCCSGR